MVTHPINQIIRFILELTALFFIGLWGWNQFEGILKFILAIGLPLFTATMWGVFAVPNDPSRSNSAPVPIPGIIRLLIEFGVFAFAVWCMFDVDYNNLSLIYLIVVIVHYTVSYGRLLWLVKQ